MESSNTSCSFLLDMYIGLRSVAATPFYVHLLTGLGVMYNWGSTYAEKDSFDWWVSVTLNCFRLGPSEGQMKTLFAMIQILASFVVIATQISSSLSVRRIGYALLVVLFCIIELRHIITGEGPESIGFLFTHIFIYAVLVLHYERTCSSAS